MKCGYCAREIPDEPVQKPCGLCTGGCRKIHCPYCGQENPVTPNYLRRIAEIARKKDSKKDDDHGAF
ncbi:MAG: hypothetical protein P8X63_06480 [Desulfuromonadaceae bacterium]|jgi:hypothetical protein